MPRRTKDAPGRTTPKGGPARKSAPAVSAKPSAAASSGRYTAPIPRELKSSPWWVPVLIVVFFALGVICILLNYLSILPGGASNAYLFVGLGLIVCGFITATRWH
jgi:Cell division protein CrgA